MVRLELMKIATFNIRYSPLEAYIPANQLLLAGDGEARWTSRLPLIIDQIEWESPDIIGFQEVLEHQYDDLKNQAVFQAYTSVGVGRDDGITRGEYVPVFWKTSKFKALSVKHLWLSDQPDVPGSIGWDAAQTRMVTVVHLQPLSLEDSYSEESDRSFFVMNTHFDDRGLKARTESAKLILRESNKLTTQTGRPILLMGDFNAPSHEAAYMVLTGKTWDECPLQAASQLVISARPPDDDAPADKSSGQYFKDCGTEVERAYGAFRATFTGFNKNPKDAQVIDFIMIMSTIPDRWKTIKYGVIPNQFENEPLASDHRMVCAVIRT